MIVTTVAWMATSSHAAEPMYDLSKEKVLYCVGYAHLDTQWRWDFCTTIDQYVRDTLEHNFQRFEQFPEYTFNFTGSVRYEMMKEYYPEQYERLKKYIADGRWFVSGSSVDEGDVNVPGAEAIIRQVLYGNQFFRREFGKESRDFMLPDCFGFPASMPSIWAHCGLLGFSTQKLTWGSAVGIPFKIGVWEGPDGNSVMAALDPGSYASALEGRVDLNEEWRDRIEANGERYGVYADYHYYGVGDQGGAPREEDVRNYVASMNNPDSLFKVALVASDQLYKDITPQQRARLPRYRGDMLLTEHSAGTLTSQSYMKRWNRKNEILADAAERATVVADWLGGAVYPREKLYKSWVRLLANQMHDILPGTSIPRAYTYSWNDEIVASNGFAAVLTDSVGAIARALDTNVEGVPVIVYNPLAIEREEIVELRLRPDAPRHSPRVYDGAGREVPSACVRVPDKYCSGEGPDAYCRIAFIARIPPLSWTVYDVRMATEAYNDDSGPKATEHGIENHCYRLTIDENGDISSIIDMRHGDRELLREPAGLVFTYERPRQWPAWNMDWADRKEPPIDRVGGPAKISVIENGPVRATVEITREARNSIITQRISLAAGSAGERIEFHTEVDWQSTECALKASFPLKDGNPKATYNWGMGTIERGNNEPKRYEVPSHEWFDVTDSFGTFGVSVLEDSKFGSDKPSDHEVRLTLLYTPGVRDGYLDQHSQDWGRHEFVYALYPHAGDWRDGKSEWQGRRLNQPLRAFTTAKHDGPLGKSVSLLKVSTPQVDVRAVKLAEESDEIIIRLQELWGRAAGDVEVALAAPITSAVEVDGQERRIGEAAVRDGKLTLQMTPFQPRSFAVKLGPPPTRLTSPTCALVKLPYNADVVSFDSNRADGKFDSAGRTLPAEELPDRITSEGIVFELGPKADGALNAVACEGQTIKLPQGDFDRIYLLAAATEDTEAHGFPSLQSWTGFVGQWDDRVWDREFDEVDYRCEGNVIGIKTGYIKRDPIAWFCTHRHHPEKGNEAYRFTYLFKYAVNVKRGDSQFKLPSDPRIKVLAMTAARNANEDTTPAAPLYDDFTGRKPIEFRHVYPPPPVPVFEGVEPVATVQIDRKERFDELSMGPPSKDDAVDRSRGGGYEFRFLSGEYRPHPGSGAEDGVFTRLNDGEAARNDDDTDRCVWYDNEGRFFVDLKRPTNIARIHTYSWHRDNRAPQFFSLWATDADEMPPADFKHGGHDGWTLLAVVKTEELGKGGVHGSSVTPREGEAAFGPYRHLLWIAEEVGQGTFFTEIDVHAAD